MQECAQREKKAKKEENFYKIFLYHIFILLKRKTKLKRLKKEMCLFWHT